MQIIEVRLLDCAFHYEPGCTAQCEMDVKVDVAVGVGFVPETDTITCSVRASNDGKDVPFTFDVTMGGQFRINEDVRGDVDRLSRINAPAIILPFVREFVADLTRRAGCDPLYLPTMNFVEAFAKAGEQKQIAE